MSIQHTKIQFLAHASFKITTPEGRTILIDPWYTDNPFLPAGTTFPENVDLILQSHGHGDHLDKKIIEYIRTYSPKVIANPAVRAYLMNNSVPDHVFDAMNVGGTVSLMDLKITMTNAVHLAHVNQPDGKMGYLHGTVGFIIWLSDDVSIYYSGDTAVFSDMGLIGEIYEPDIAILPIGDRFTMGPLEAAFATRLLKVNHVIPCHYGSMSYLSGTPERLKELTQDLNKLEIHALKPGEELDTSSLKLKQW
ncbi:metal-dependent hydrolase [Chitinophaga sp. Cy-1792]|uniref:metal-dependent hydrolase n=1 Tax=Chitinophaga sp. Cy-1792 TaxID=2608339 RepID=UPI00141E3DC7|nr:metal-dependent hydrolase [Chitinophaga sp. Cy-1792]